MTRVARELPIRTKSEANQREHWAAKHRRTRQQRRAVRLALGGDLLPMTIPEEAELRVKLTRLGIRQLDTDNLAGSFKAIRDEVAALLGRDDAPDSGVEWVYEQEKSRTYGVRIEVEEA